MNMEKNWSIGMDACVYSKTQPAFLIRKGRVVHVHPFYLIIQDDLKLLHTVRFTRYRVNKEGG